MTFEPRQVYFATLLLSLSLAGIAAAVSAPRSVRWTISGLAVAASLAMFGELTSGITLFTAHLSVLNGVCVWAVFWLFARARRVSLRGISPELKYGLLVGAGVVALMALPNALRTSDEDEALAAGRRFVALLRDQDLVVVYNVLHPRLKEHASWPDIRTALTRHARAFRHLSIVEVETHRDFDEVICETEDRERLVLRQAHFSGQGRVTDGKIMSLRDYANDMVIVDILVSGQSIFG